MQRKRKRTKILEHLLQIEDKKLKKFLVQYCKSYGGKVKHLGQLLQKMGIALPTQLEKFDGKSKFATSTGEEITVGDDIEDYISIITIKKENVEKTFQCYFQHLGVELKQVTVANDERKVEIYFGTVISQISMQEETLKFSPNEAIKEYVEQLRCSIEPLKIWEGFQLLF